MRAGLTVVAVVILLVTAYGMGGTAVATAMAGDGGGTVAMAGTPDPSNTSNVSFGIQFAAFMQATAAQTSDTVETGMGVATAANASANRSQEALAEQNRQRLERRIEELEADKRAVVAAYENGSISRVTYQARLGRLVGRLTALENRIRSGPPGLNRSNTRSLRQRMADVAGGDVGRVANGLRGQAGPPDWLGTDGSGGPPSDTGPNNPGPPTNASEPGGAGNGNGTSDGGTNGKSPDTGNDTDPPAHNETDQGQGKGQGN